MTLHPKIQQKLLAEFRSGTCNKCTEFSKIELKCTMADLHSSQYFTDETFNCPIGEF